MTAAAIQARSARLRDARQKAGYASAKEAASALGVPTPTFVHHENGGRGFGIDLAFAYARFFGVSFVWLCLGPDAERGPDRGCAP